MVYMVTVRFLIGNETATPFKFCIEWMILPPTFFSSKTCGRQWCCMGLCHCLRNAGGGALDLTAPSDPSRSSPPSPLQGDESPPVSHPSMLSVGFLAAVGVATCPLPDPRMLPAGTLGPHRHGEHMHALV